jgi:hypothetical protein
MSEELKSTVGNSEVEELAYVYKDIYEAPAHLRVHRSARLSLSQINALVADAYANMLPAENGVRDTAIPDFGSAKKRFEETHKIEKGFWVSKGEGE